jgi:hypothetical protein
MARPINTLLLEQAQAPERPRAGGSSSLLCAGIAMARSMFGEGSKFSATSLSEL